VKKRYIFLILILSWILSDLIQGFLNPRIIFHAPEKYTVECSIQYGNWSKWEADRSGGRTANDDWEKNQRYVKYISPSTAIKIYCPYSKIKTDSGMDVFWRIYDGELINRKKYLLFDDIDISDLREVKSESFNYLFLWNRRGDFDFYRMDIYIDDTGKVYKKEKFNLFGRKI
jgi:hypothetical protein